MLKIIDNLLNSITMYKLMLYLLSAFAALAIAFSFLKLLPFSPFQFIATFILLFVSCSVANFIFSKIFKAVVNYESYAITALILFFILSPIVTTSDIFVTFSVGVLAMASKYILAIHKKHIYNPAAISVVVLGLLGFGNAIWWVGSGILLPFSIIIGFLIVRKIRRFSLLFSFLIFAILTLSLFNLANNISVLTSLQQILTSWPLIFFGTVMLIEPQTTPPRKNLQILYGILVGILFGSRFEIGTLFSSPELSLVLGNIFSYLVSPKEKLFLRFNKRIEISPNIYEFIFTGKKLSFTAGQYLEWTIDQKGADSRGNRRHFTIASSPTEENVRLGVKVFGDKSSSFKKKLLLMEERDQIIGSGLSGDFVLPRERDQKLVFIAGGIGATPFRSMIKYLIDKGESRDIVLFYTNIFKEDFAYTDIFEKAEKIGVKTVYVLTDSKNIPDNWKGGVGYIDGKMIESEVSDYKYRKYYLSGPNVMVDAYKKLLQSIGISRNQIVTDYFPGY